jgi:AcrR family transcriptional regulator
MAMTGRRTTQSSIITATLSLIAEHGFHGASTQMIADKANVGVGSIYRYFKGKDDLIHAVANDIEDNLGHALLKGDPEGLQFKERFVRLSLNMASYLIDNPAEFSFMEQYYASPYGISKGKEMLVWGGLGSKKSAGYFKSLFEDGKAGQLIKDLPLVALYALTLGSIVFLVKSRNAGIFDLDEMTIQKTIEESWNVISEDFLPKT